MRKLWERYGKGNVGYTAQDYAQLVDEVAGQSFQSYFDNFINGTAPIEQPLDEALHFVGCTLKEQQNPLRHEGRYGFKVSTEGSAKVTAVAPGSPASELLSIDDELVALNGRKLENNLQQLLALEPKEVELVLFRDKQLRVVRLEQNQESYYSKYTVEKRANATAAEKENFKRWLKQEF